MATVYANADGRLVRFLQTDAEEALHANHPHPDAVVSLEFDEKVNHSICSAISSDWDSHSIVSGVLRRNGQPVVIVLDGADRAEKKAAITLKAKLEPGGENLTQAEIKRLFRFLFRKIGV